jgi:RNA-directed DNA polymerase
VAWDGISWADVQRQVRRLQARIVKWTQAGKHNKVKALQWLLTHSFSGKALAVKRVTENKGKNTPGVDKVIWKTPGTKTNAIASLKRRGYSALPLRRVMILKKNGKMRPLGIPVMRCRAMQALHLLALEPVAETTADPNSYGFRPERSTAEIASRSAATSGKSMRTRALAFGIGPRPSEGAWSSKGSTDDIPDIAIPPREVFRKARVCR